MRDATPRDGLEDNRRNDNRTLIYGLNANAMEAPVRGLGRLLAAGSGHRDLVAEWLCRVLASSYTSVRFRPRCSIPDDRRDPRRSAFFMARSVLRECGGAENSPGDSFPAKRNQVRPCLSIFASKRRSSHCPPLVRGRWRGPKVRAAIRAGDAPASVLAERFGSSEGQKTIR